MKELSKKSEYWLPKDRFMELKYFVKQIKYFRAKYEEILYSRAGGYLVHMSSDKIRRVAETKNDPTAKKAISGAVYKEYLDDINKAIDVLEAKMKLDGYYEGFGFVISGILDDISYDRLCALRSRHEAVPPISRRKYYEYVRYFFWGLDQIRTQNLQILK